MRRKQALLLLQEELLHSPHLQRKQMKMRRPSAAPPHLQGLMLLEALNQIQHPSAEEVHVDAFILLQRRYM